MQASVAAELGDFAKAWRLVEECVAIGTEIGDQYNRPFFLEVFAEIAALRGEPRRAMLLLGAAAALREESGQLLQPAFQARNEQWLEPVRQALGGAEGAAAMAEGRTLTFDEALEYALGGRPPEGAPPQPALRESHGAVGLLTDREAAVASLVMRGLTNRQVGQALGIAEGTVARHVEHSLRKLGFQSRTQLATWAVERRLGRVAAG